MTEIGRRRDSCEHDFRLVKQRTHANGWTFAKGKCRTCGAVGYAAVAPGGSVADVRWPKTGDPKDEPLPPARLPWSDPRSDPLADVLDAVRRARARQPRGAWEQETIRRSREQVARRSVADDET